MRPNQWVDVAVSRWILCVLVLLASPVSRLESGVTGTYCGLVTVGGENRGILQHPLPYH